MSEDLTMIRHDDEKHENKYNHWFLLRFLLLQVHPHAKHGWIKFVG